jgi:hypothetical protein
MTVRYLSTKETAVLVRQALKAAFPGTKFSVRMGTGTGSAWLSVSWTDGPLDADVTTLVDRYAGSVWNLNGDDSYVQNPNTLMLFEGQELPEEVHFVVSGINTHRNMSEDAEKAVTARLVEALNGREFNAENLSWLMVGDVWVREVGYVERAIWQVFAATDFTKVTA